MTQNNNNMVNFLTLTNLDSELIELNPAFIVLMKRDTYHPEEGVSMPFTKIYLSSGINIHVLQTPEQIAEMQLDGIKSVMTTMMDFTQQIFEDFD